MLGTIFRYLLALLRYSFYLMKLWHLKRKIAQKSSLLGGITKLSCMPNQVANTYLSILVTPHAMIYSREKGKAAHLKSWRRLRVPRSFDNGANLYENYSCTRYGMEGINLHNHTL